MNEPAAERAKPTVVRLKDKALVDQICAQARDAILNNLRERTELIFWRSSLRESFSPYHLGRFLGFGRNDKLDFNSVAKVLAHFSPMKFRTFDVIWTADDEHYPAMTISLKEANEWTDVLGEAWEGLECPPHGLSEPAARLLEWARQEKNQKQWTDKSAIGRQARLRGTSWTADFLTHHLKEIQRKANAGLCFEEKDGDFRLWFEQPKLAPGLHQHGPLNPLLTIDFKEVVYANLNQFRETLYEWILGAQLPPDSAELLIWRIHDRATLHRCFPAWLSQNWEASTLYGFLGEVGLDHGLLWGYSFKDPDPWEYLCRPKDGLTWENVTSSIRAARSLPPLHERYGISLESAALVKWFTTLRQKEWLGALTPPVEDQLQKRIGISAQHGDRDNFGVYLSMLAEEITEKTEWKVSVHEWKGGWGGAAHRLLVKRKATDVDDITRRIQMWGLEKGKLLRPERVKEMLHSLLEENAKPKAD